MNYSFVLQCFTYEQDPHHYFQSNYGVFTLSEYQSRDVEKHKLASEKGITLIDIPFWWEWDAERQAMICCSILSSVISLIATIKSKRPDLLADKISTAVAISEDVPENIAEKWNYGKFVCLLSWLTLMQTSLTWGLPCQLCICPSIEDLIRKIGRYSEKELKFTTNRWVFEKYDGIRAIWNCFKRQLYSRWGTPLNIPNYIRDEMPEQLWIDGEVSSFSYFLTTI